MSNFNILEINKRKSMIKKTDEEKNQKALPPHIDDIVNEIMDEDKVLLEKLSKD